MIAVLPTASTPTASYPGDVEAAILLECGGPRPTTWLAAYCGCMLGQVERRWPVVEEFLPLFDRMRVASEFPPGFGDMAEACHLEVGAPPTPTPAPSPAVESTGEQPPSADGGLRELAADTDRNDEHRTPAAGALAARSRRRRRGPARPGLS